MSNKLYKTPPPKIKSFRMVYIIFAIFSLCFVYVWGSIINTSIKFNNNLNSAIENKDYFIEEITIVKKDYDSYYSTPDTSIETTNYFFYYSSDKKMQVDRDTYVKYSVGDKISAYTADHKNYKITKEAILPQDEFKENEIKKPIGVILGILTWSLFLYIKFEKIKTS